MQFVVQSDMHKGSHFLSALVHLNVHPVKPVILQIGALFFLAGIPGNVD